MSVSFKSVYRGQVTKLCNNAEEYLASAESQPQESNRDSIDKIEDEIGIYLERLKGVRENLNKSNCDFLANVKQEDIARECELIAEYDDKSSATIARLNQRLIRLGRLRDGNCANHEVRSESRSDSKSESRHNAVKLPKLTLIKFAGEYEQWQPLWEQFLAVVHENRSLNGTDKFMYLQSALSGKAAKTIAGFTPSATCYEDAINLLKEEFGNSEKIVDKTIQSLINLKALNYRSDAIGLRHLYNSVDTATRTLTALGVQTSRYAIVLRSVLLRALPSELRVDFYRSREHLAIKSNDESDASSEADSEGSISFDGDKDVEALIRFLKLEVEALEKATSSKLQGLEKATSSKPQPKSSQNYRPSVYTAAHTSHKCGFCGKSVHSPFKCELLISKSPAERFQLVKGLKLCINCLKPGHSLHECKSRTCQVCSKQHHTLLHFEKPVANTHVAQSSETSNSIATSCETMNHHASQQHTFVVSNNSQARDAENIILATALIEAKSACGNFITCRALLDSASQYNFVTRRLAQNLGLKLEPTNSQIIGIGATNTSANYVTEFVIKSKVNNFTTRIGAMVLKTIAGSLPNKHFHVSNLHIPPNATLADSFFNQPQRIDVLIGADLFFGLLSVGQIKISPNTSAILQKTVLAWIVSGSIPRTGNSLVSTLNSSSKLQKVDESLNKLVQRFWTLEEPLTSTTSIIGEDGACERHFMETFSRDKSGRFHVRLPFREPPTVLGDSYEVARKRFGNLETKLLKSPALKRDYSKFINEFNSLGHMEEITNQPVSSKVYYLPHHPVFKEDSSSTRLRVVFDGSCKTTKGNSLNNILMVGPTLQDDLMTILLRFRSYPYALVADIVKMYRQVQVAPEDRNLQCILWREEPDSILRTFRLSTVTYGTACAAYLAIRSMIQLAKEEIETFPVGSHHVLHNFYVDNLICGANSISELINIKNEVRNLLARGCFPLRKWCSNAAEVISDINEDDKESSFKIGDHDVIKALGLFWNPREDEFIFQLPTTTTDPSSRITKRIILSQIAALFDPLGLLNPVILSGKIFLQHLWSIRLDWDETFPMDLHNQWLNFRAQLPELGNIQLPRYAAKLNSKIQIHGFCDARLKAYGACIYLRSCDSRNNITVHLFCAKSRVAPIRSPSLARLELCGALLLAELLKKVTTSLTIPIEDIFCWTDSTIALSWIRSTANQWSIFVANRISKILELTEASSWSHVPGDQNPADLVSRGCVPEQLKHNKLWFHGPDFLLLSKNDWPSFSDLIAEDLPERKKVKFSFVCADDRKVTDLVQASKFANSYTHLTRVFCYIRRMLPHAAPAEFKNKEISPEEFDTTTKFIVKYLQSIYFAQEFKQLSKGALISSQSRILRLNPFLDTDNVIRVGGRLRHSKLTYDAKHQILLPSKHSYTTALIRHYHQINLHAGCQTVLNLIRQKYWIVDGARTARNVLRCCIICFRSRPKLSSQIMGDQHPDRLSPRPPFSVTGIDYMGPLYVTQRIRGRPPIKAYIAVFICFTTRAVHLELVHDLTTQAFVAALRRFMARRGKCIKIFSDNATNFVGARNELEELRKHFLSSNHNNIVEQFASSEGISWKFIPPRSPHFGGLWEAAVKIAKRHLNKIIASTSNFSFTYEEMNTLVCQIEAVMNSRPISPMSNDPNDLDALTPGHFLVGRPLTSIPEVSNTSSLNRLSHYQRIQHMQQLFWERWRKDYINNMQSRGKWIRATSNVNLGDLVLVKEDDVPPLKWLMGRIVELHPGTDGRIRVASIKTKFGEFKRSITKVAVLPIEDTS